MHLYLGTVEQHLGNSAQSQEYALEALRIAKEIGDPEKICTANISLGALAGERGKLMAESLADAINRAVTDEGMRHRAASLGEHIRAEDGVSQAVALISSQIESR